MKHISAILGPPENCYVEKFAWLPKQLHSGSFVWLTKYIQKQTTWRWYKDAPVVARLNISIEDAVLEKLKETV